MKHFLHAVVLVAVLAGHSNAYVDVPPASPGTVIGTYDFNTGEVQVAANGVINWYIEHIGHTSMTGDAPVGLPGASGLVTDNDTRIGESHFVPFSYEVNLGTVTAPGIIHGEPLNIYWNASLGGELQYRPLIWGGPLTLPDAPPTAAIDGPITVNTFSDPLNILLDASDSVYYDTYGIWGPLTYEWDLDNNGTFEVDTGTNPMLAIADVTSTFGGQGSYPVTVKVYDGFYTDIATTTLELVVPEPTAMFLVGLGLLGGFAIRRRSVV